MFPSNATDTLQNEYRGKLEKDRKAKFPFYYSKLLLLLLFDFSEPYFISRQPPPPSPLSLHLTATLCTPDATPSRRTDYLPAKSPPLHPSDIRSPLDQSELVISVFFLFYSETESGSVPHAHCRSFFRSPRF